MNKSIYMCIIIWRKYSGGEGIDRRDRRRFELVTAVKGVSGGSPSVKTVSKIGSIKLYQVFYDTAEIVRRINVSLYRGRYQRVDAERRSNTDTPQGAIESHGRTNSPPPPPTNEIWRDRNRRQYSYSWCTDFSFSNCKHRVHISENIMYTRINMRRMRGCRLERFTRARRKVVSLGGRKSDEEKKKKRAAKDREDNKEEEG